MQCVLAVLFFIIFSFSFSQISENYSDGDFTNSPVWSGTTNDFMVNASKQLQTNSSVASTSFLTTSHNLTNLNTKEWRFWIKMGFAPSANNFSKVYLIADNTDLSINPDGFYLLFGETGSQDAVRLYKQVNGVSTEICSGIAGEIASSFAISVRILRDDLGNWRLFIDPSGGENFVNGFSGFDPENIIGTSFGVLCKYTISNANKFYFDNFYVGDEILDVLPPSLVSATPSSTNQVDVLFDQPLLITSAENSVNYSIDPSHEITSASLDNLNPALVHLSLNPALVNGTSYVVTANNIIDLSGNSTVSQSVSFTYMIAEMPIAGDVIINEFMCDPSPSVDLPEVEYVEIYNKSNKYFHLQNWKIGDNTSFGTISGSWLSPGGFVVLCSSASLAFYPNAVSVSSFPSLNNAGDEIVLMDDNGSIIDQLTYTDEWYKDDAKKAGGYSLERIKPYLPCSSENNWKASISETGGTPFMINSVFDNSPDLDVPAIVSLFVQDPTTLEIQFSEGMDSISLVNLSLTTNPSLIVQNITFDSPFPTGCQIHFFDTIKSSQEYTVTLPSISDCSSNQTDLSDYFYLPEQAMIGDLVVNEILYNPLSGGSDFIELYNSSNKIIDLYHIEIAHFDDDTISGHVQVENHQYLKPNGYVYISADTSFIKSNYPFTAISTGIEMELPSFDSDSSTIYIICDSEVIDRVSYSDDWQFSLIEDTKGKSLEKINPVGDSNSSTNWHTAAESVDFATPGSKNSQHSEGISSGDFDFINTTISPDNDGFEDVLFVCYSTGKTGMVATFKIYDDRGQLIKTVFKNELLATEGTFSWDGLSDSAIKAPIGVYIGCFEAFHVETGSKMNIRKAFSVAGKF